MQSPPSAAQALRRGLRGRCPACGGNGFEHVEMQFLSDVYLRCPDCDGKRYRPEILEVKIERAGRNMNVADVLDLNPTDSKVGGNPALNDVLKIDGNAGDTLHLSSSDGWSAADTASLAGYAIYTHQNVKVAVDHDINVQVS